MPKINAQKKVENSLAKTGRITMSDLCEVIGSSFQHDCI